MWRQTHGLSSFSQAALRFPGLPPRAGAKGRRVAPARKGREGARAGKKFNAARTVMKVIVLLKYSFSFWLESAQCCNALPEAITSIVWDACTGNWSSSE